MMRPLSGVDDPARQWHPLLHAVPGLPQVGMEQMLHLGLRDPLIGSPRDRPLVPLATIHADDALTVIEHCAPWLGRSATARAGPWPESANHLGSVRGITAASSFVTECPMWSWS